LAPLLVGVTSEKPAPALGPVNVLSAIPAPPRWKDTYSMNTATMHPQRCVRPTPGSIVGGVGHPQGCPCRCCAPRPGADAGFGGLPTTTAGYRMLSEWLSSFGPLAAVGVEGTGCWVGAWPDTIEVP